MPELSWCCQYETYDDGKKLWCKSCGASKYKMRQKMINHPDTIRYWLEIIRTEAKTLTKWEEDFIDSVSEQFATNRYLSNKQEAIIEKIYKKEIK